MCNNMRVFICTALQHAEGLTSFEKMSLVLVSVESLSAIFSLPRNIQRRGKWCSVTECVQTNTGKHLAYNTAAGIMYSESTTTEILVKLQGTEIYRFLTTFPLCFQGDFYT